MRIIKLLPIAALIFVGCGDDTNSITSIDKIQYSFNGNVFKEKVFSYDKSGRISKTILTELDHQVELQRTIFSYSENQTRLHVNGDDQLHNLLFEDGRLVEYAFHMETSMPGTYDKDTITFKYELGDIKAIRLNNVDYAVAVDGHGNITQIDGWDITFTYDDKPNPFRGIPTELIAFNVEDSELSYLNILNYFNKNNVINLSVFQYTYKNGRVSKIKSIGASGFESVQEISYKLF